MSDAREATGLHMTTISAPVLPLPSAGGTPTAGGEANELRTA